MCQQSRRGCLARAAAMPPNFLGGLRGLKLKDLPSYVNKHATENWTPGRVKERTMNFLHQYKEKYIDTGSVKPLFDTMAILFVSSYIIAYPHVRTCTPAEQPHSVVHGWPPVFSFTAAHPFAGVFGWFAVPAGKPRKAMFSVAFQVVMCALCSPLQSCVPLASLHCGGTSEGPLGMPVLALRYWRPSSHTLFQVPSYTGCLGGVCALVPAALHTAHTALCNTDT